MSRSKDNNLLVIGGEPAVDLLPPEVHRQRRAKVVRRHLGLGVIGTIAIVVVATGASVALAMLAQSQLETEQALTVVLAKQQADYAEVRIVQGEVALATAAQQVGVSTEIDWKKYLEGVQAVLPASVTISTVAIDSATPLAVYTQSTAPLQGDRVATVSFTAKTSALPDVPTWMNSLATLPGYADALPATVTRSESGVYTATITMHVNDAAYAHRFADEEK
ncbi:hypothetical protein [Cryobacterium arcticum]|uniref:Fimbrial assembly protein n=1 Tax=Cryobacterium arcticum TaxID=670052 RepID=A0A1B1BN69_9MICO|nr:hypothetical protein [Cryobacterium arcticum]ANP73946.1 hypothetical protein PA27867_3010 [Cryobacterium arcticum]